MDDYSVVKTIGRGSFGRVLHCHRRKDGISCAIKQVETLRITSKEKHEAQREAALLSKLDHAFIIGYLDCFFTGNGNTLCLVMEFADGGDLHGFIKAREGRLLSEVRVLDWFVQISLALKHIHDRKILHRDLKSKNIFLSKDNKMKVGDFGISKVLDHTLDNAKTATGTPYYLSPEICQMKKYNSKSDMWSLGCILYELATLCHPFTASSFKELMHSICHNDPEPIPERYSKDIGVLIRDLLHKDPNERPSASDVLSNSFLTARVERYSSKSRDDKYLTEKPAQSSILEVASKSTEHRSDHDVFKPPMKNDTTNQREHKVQVSSSSNPIAGHLKKVVSMEEPKLDHKPSPQSHLKRAFHDRKRSISVPPEKSNRNNSSASIQTKDSAHSATGKNSTATKHVTRHSTLMADTKASRIRNEQISQTPASTKHKPTPSRGDFKSALIDHHKTPSKDSDDHTKHSDKSNSSVKKYHRGTKRESDFKSNHIADSESDISAKNSKMSAERLKMNLSDCLKAISNAQRTVEKLPIPAGSQELLSQKISCISEDSKNMVSPANSVSVRNSVQESSINGSDNSSNRSHERLMAITRESRKTKKETILKEKKIDEECEAELHRVDDASAEITAVDTIDDRSHKENIEKCHSPQRRRNENESKVTVGINPKINLASPSKFSKSKIPTPRIFASQCINSTSSRESTNKLISNSNSRETPKNYSMSKMTDKLIVTQRDTAKAMEEANERVLRMQNLHKSINRATAKTAQLTDSVAREERRDQMESDLIDIKSKLSNMHLSKKNSFTSADKAACQSSTATALVKKPQHTADAENETDSQHSHRSPSVGSSIQNEGDADGAPFEPYKVILNGPMSPIENDGEEQIFIVGYPVKKELQKKLKLRSEDTDALRLEVLRIFLEKRLGLPNFLRSYRYLKAMGHDNLHDPIIVSQVEGFVGGPSYRKFIPYLQDLLLMERRFEIQ